jgi:hypothetical protein
MSQGTILFNHFKNYFMKVNIKSRQVKMAIKKIILFLILAITIIKADAQRSGLVIGILSNHNIADGKGGIEPATAALRKEVVRDKVDLKNPLLENPKEKVVITDDKKNITPKTITPPAITTSGTIYDIPGNTAISQYTSLQANFQFSFYNITNRTLTSPAGVIELYKLEKGANTRSFCIPSGGCASVNIPIQITANGQPVVASAGTGGGAGAATGKSPMYLVVLPNGGYLQPGEYAFIDKSSLKPDGSALVCFTFTVKQ